MTISKEEALNICSLIKNGLYGYGEKYSMGIACEELTDYIEQSISKDEIKAEVEKAKKLTFNECDDNAEFGLPGSEEYGGRR